jgi:hypothetical protein
MACAAIAAAAVPALASGRPAAADGAFTAHDNY